MISATLTGAKDADSPCHTILQGEKGWIKVLGKPNVPQGIDLEYWDEGKPNVPSPSGGMDRAMIKEHYEAPELAHRMVPEFTEFARIIDTKDREAADRCAVNSLNVIRVLETSRKGAGIRFGIDG